MKYYISRFIIAVLITTPIYLAIRRPWRYRDKREWFLGAFFIYIVALLSLVFDTDRRLNPDIFAFVRQRIEDRSGVNFVPFRSIKIFWAHGTADEIWVNIISNIAIFVPWGYALPLLWKKYQNPIRHIIMCFLLTFSIEFIQLFIGRNADVDDIMLNLIGGLAGGLIYIVSSRCIKGLSYYAK